MHIEVQKKNLQRLADALAEKAKEVYLTEKMEFVIKSTPNNYAILAEKINQANNAKDKPLQKEWLSRLFYSEVKKDKTRLDDRNLNYIAQYLGQGSWKQFCDEESAFFQKSYEGVYEVYWKGTTFETDNDKIEYEYNLEMKGDKAYFRHIGKKDVYEGSVDVLTANLYVNLVDTKGVEKVSIFIHIGINETSPYLSALFLAVNNTQIPCSGPLLLFKKGRHDNIIAEDKAKAIAEKLEWEEEFKKEYFRRYSRKTLLKAIRTDKLSAMMHDLHITYNEQEKITGLQGTWLVIAHKSDGTLEQSKMLIKRFDNITYDSSGGTYQKGNIHLKSGEFVIINLIGDNRFANIIGEIGYVDKLDTVKYINCVYTSTGRFSPKCGILLLIKTEKEYKDIALGKIEKAELQNYNIAQGMLDKFLKTGTIYLRDVQGY